MALFVWLCVRLFGLCSMGLIRFWPVRVRRWDVLLSSYQEWGAKKDDEEGVRNCCYIMSKGYCTGVEFFVSGAASPEFFFFFCLLSFLFISFHSLSFTGAECVRLTHVASLLAYLLKWKLGMSEFISARNGLCCCTLLFVSLRRFPATCLYYDFIFFQISMILCK